MLIQQTLIQYLLQKKNLCEIFKVLTIWGNINLFIRPQHHEMLVSKNVKNVQKSYPNYSIFPVQIKYILENLLAVQN